MNINQISSILQLNYSPTHIAKFDTLQIIDNIQIPKTYWNTGSSLEPITSSFPSLGSGGATQAITNTPIKNFILNEIKK